MIAWIDKNRKAYKMNEISNQYLINILNYTYSGGGWDSFVNIESMERLYDESVKRKLNFNIGKYMYMESIKQRLEDNEYLSRESELNDFDWMNNMF